MIETKLLQPETREVITEPGAPGEARHPWRDGLLLATGWTRTAVIERDTGRPLPLPDWVRDVLGGIPR